MGSTSRRPLSPAARARPTSSPCGTPCGGWRATWVSTWSGSWRSAFGTQLVHSGPGLWNPARRVLEREGLPATDDNVFTLASFGERGLRFPRGQGKVLVGKRDASAGEAPPSVGPVVARVGDRAYTVVLNGGEAVVDGVPARCNEVRAPRGMGPRSGPPGPRRPGRGEAVRTEPYPLNPFRGGSRRHSPPRGGGRPTRPRASSSTSLAVWGSGGGVESPVGWSVS